METSEDDREIQPKRCQNKKIRSDLLWTISPKESHRQKPEWLGTLHLEREVDKFSTYSEMCFDDEIFDVLVYQSNLYSAQKDHSKLLSVLQNEMD